MRLTNILIAKVALIRLSETKKGYLEDLFAEIKKELTLSDLVKALATENSEDNLEGILTEYLGAVFAALDCKALVEYSGFKGNTREFLINVLIKEHTTNVR